MLTVNGRSYTTPDTLRVGICLDGTAPDYLEQAAAVMPNLQRFIAQGASGLAQSVIPSFTNPNNVAMVTGVPPKDNGICGNYYYDVQRGEEVMMNDPQYLLCPTILAAFGNAGLAVAAVTVKDKLRRLLGKGLRGICFSVEYADKATRQENGIQDVLGLMGRAAPTIYDPEISVYCLEAGVLLAERFQPRLMYLTTTDFVQHKYAPGSAEANRFYARIDEVLGRLDRLGAVLGITADHGMNAKTNPDGSPKVVFIEALLKAQGIPEARVILPINDPYIVHHGALGSFATVYLDEVHIEKAVRLLRATAGVEAVLPRQEAAARFALPPNRIGELVLLSDQGTVLGRTPEWHDLKVVERGLRSHGGLHERRVPLIFNRPLEKAFKSRLASGESNNYDLFDYLCNGMVS